MFVVRFLDGETRKTTSPDLLRYWVETVREVVKVEVRKPRKRAEQKEAKQNVRSGRLRSCGDASVSDASLCNCHSS